MINSHKLFIFCYFSGLIHILNPSGSNMMTILCAIPKAEIHDIINAIQLVSVNDIDYLLVGTH